jgi:tetratricopeptide (TPR) repeat protein
MVAENSAELAKIYVAAGDLEPAEEAAQTALNAVRRAGDKFHLPINLTQLGDVKTARGEYAEAAHCMKKLLIS